MPITHNTYATSMRLSQPKMLLFNISAVLLAHWCKSRAKRTMHSASNIKGHRACTRIAKHQSVVWLLVRVGQGQIRMYVRTVNAWKLFARKPPYGHIQCVYISVCTKIEQEILLKVWQDRSKTRAPPLAASEAEAPSGSGGS